MKHKIKFISLTNPKDLFLLSLDILILSVSHYLSFYLRFSGEIMKSEIKLFYMSLPWVLTLYIVAFVYFGLYRSIWRYSSLADLRRVVMAVFTGTVLVAACGSILGWIAHGYPRSVLIINMLLVLVLVGGLRFSRRIIEELKPSFLNRAKTKEGVLIIGAGDIGARISKDVKNGRYVCIGFVDNDKSKQGKSINGIPILGKINDIPQLVRRYPIDILLFAIPAVTRAEMKEILNISARTKAKFLTTPAPYEIGMEGQIRLSDVRKPNIADLLRREVVQLDTKAIENYIFHRAIMVTGAGGSIGSELCRQICRFNPSKVILYDRYENNLFLIKWELAEKFPATEIVGIIGDINDAAKVEQIIKENKPSVIFHTAAHKHVSLVELDPVEGVINNVGGTKVLAAIVDKLNVEKFILVSTDKAANPQSVMGITKRIAEMFVQGLDKLSQTSYITVRFGNVLGSSGSVVPLFMEQINRGGPITVTHPEATRFFMTVSEAAQLILQAAAIGKGGEIFVLDMGEPVRILDLAHDLLLLAGLSSGEDIKVVFTGLRPGEKLCEEVVGEGEVLQRTTHAKINFVQGPMPNFDELRYRIDELISAACAADKTKTIDMLKKMVVPSRTFNKIGQQTVK